MGIRSTGRSLLAVVRQRVTSMFHPPPRPHRPDLGDATFINCLSSGGGLLRAASERFATGDIAAARSLVVDHFLDRRAPRFFCDAQQVEALVATLRCDRARWVDALRARVEADVNCGLQVVSLRGAPLTGEFDWANIPPGPGDDSLFGAQPHRFGFVPRLALAAHYGMPTPVLVASLIDRWIAVAESGTGKAYLSPLVVLYRVLALSWAFVFIAGLRTTGNAVSHHDLLFQILKVLRADAGYLKDAIGHSYPNNHLLADGFAGWYCGTLFPEFPAAAQLREKGEAIFLGEMARQFYDDGANFEHSTHYHELGCEMAVAYVLLSRRNGVEPADEIVQQLKRMLAFQVALCGPEAVPFPIGDSTEDPLFPLDAKHGWAAGAMRELYRAIFDADIDVAPEDDITVERAYWLLGGALAVPSPSPAGVLPKVFAQGGFYILDDSTRRARLVLRSGPVEGEQLSAGHAHADLLNVYLSVGGLPLVVDSGTYTYRLKSAAWPPLEADWRSYFAGPDSHNGILVGADPYGALLGDFRPPDIQCRVAPTRLVEASRLAWLEFAVSRENVASGYRRGVVHIEGHYWLVYDVLPEGVQAPATSIGLQFACGTTVSSGDGKTVDVTIGEASCRVALGAGFAEPRLLIGSTNPLGGWVSPRYGEMLPAPQLRVAMVKGGGPFGFVLQAAGEAAATCAITAGMSGDSWIAFRIVDGGFTDVLLVRTSNSEAPMAAWDIEFDGSLIWLRVADGKLTEWRSTGGNKLLYRGKRVANTDAARAC